MRAPGGAVHTGSINGSSLDQWTPVPTRSTTQRVVTTPAQCGRGHRHRRRWGCNLQRRLLFHRSSERDQTGQIEHTSAAVLRPFPRDSEEQLRKS